MRTAAFKAVVFDFNGVLLWDGPFQVQVWQETAVELRGRKLTNAELDGEVHGRTNADVLSYLTGSQLHGDQLIDLIQMKESKYRDLCRRHAEVFVLSPGAESLLDFLRLRGVPRTIATSSERSNLDFFVEELELGRWFDTQDITYDDGTLPGKPAPDMYASAAAKTGVLPRECIVVEDSVSGLEAACGAGIGCVVALGPRQTHAKLLAHEGVGIAIESLEHFPRGMLA